MLATIVLLCCMAGTVPARAQSTRVTLGPAGSVITASRVVALTFDDGPSTYTPQILAILRAFHAHATFFTVGWEVAFDPSAVRQELRDGNEVGDHTYTHPNLLYLPSAQVQAQLADTQAAIQAATGVRPIWFRPPYEAFDSRIVGIASALGMRTVLWSIDPRDWSLPGTAAIVQRVLMAVRPGSIVLMHDGGGNRSETVAALPIILRTLQDERYRFLTLSELFGLHPAPPCGSTVATRPGSCPSGRRL